MESWTYQMEMAALRRVEPIAFLLLFIAVVYFLFVCTPASARFDLSQVETLAGWATVATAAVLAVLRCLPNRLYGFERGIYAAFLAAMPVVYFVASLRGDRSGMGIELVGVAIFVGLAMIGYFKSFFILGLGIALHGVGWDLWHHHSCAYIAPGYPFGCLVVDVLMGLLVFIQAATRSLPQALHPPLAAAKNPALVATPQS